MAQTKRKRRRKHRGTQAGTVESRGRTGRTTRPRTATDAKQVRKDRREERLDTPPSWRSSLNRAALSAVVFGVLAVLLLNVPPASAVALTAVMVLLYLPLSYYTDRFIYNRRQRRKTTGGGR